MEFTVVSGITKKNQDMVKRKTRGRTFPELILFRGTKEDLLILNQAAEFHKTTRSELLRDLVHSLGPLQQESKF